MGHNQKGKTGAMFKVFVGGLIDTVWFLHSAFAVLDIVRILSGLTGIAAMYILVRSHKITNPYYQAYWILVSAIIYGTIGYTGLRLYPIIDFFLFLLSLLVAIFGGLFIILGIDELASLSRLR